MSEKNAAYVMLGISVLSEGSKMLSNMISSESGGYILNPRALPLHLCSLLLFAIGYIAFAKESDRKQTVIDFFAPVALVGGICAMLIPTNGVDFADPEAYQCFVYHAGIVWFALYLLVTKRAKLCRKTYFRNLLILFVLEIGSLYVNSILSAYGTNFLYTVRPPMQDLPVLNLDHGWLVYFLILTSLGLLLLTLVHLPFLLRKKASDR